MGRKPGYIRAIDGTMLGPNEIYLPKPPVRTPREQALWHTFQRAERTREFALTGNQKLKPTDVQWIRAFVHAGISYMKIADCFNVSYATIFNIKSGRTWRSIGYEPPNVSEAPRPTDPYILFIRKDEQGNEVSRELFSPDAKERFLENCADESEAKKFLVERFGLVDPQVKVMD